jgi:hypothetical protein
MHIPTNEGWLRMDSKEAIAKLEAHFGSRLGVLGAQVILQSLSRYLWLIEALKGRPAKDEDANGTRWM